MGKGQTGAISIHAPLRGRLPAVLKALDVGGISIHAPLRGRRDTEGFLESCKYFNPRPLAGATRSLTSNFLPILFQSTPPCGGDRWIMRIGKISVNFNPRPLAGATWKIADALDMDLFQSTPPCGGDVYVDDDPSTSVGFQSTPPCGGDLQSSRQKSRYHSFQSTPPCGGDLDPTTV